MKCIREQEILVPTFNIIPLGVPCFNNEGVIDTYYSLSGKSSDSLKIIRRRYPDGSVNWFEQMFVS